MNGQLTKEYRGGMYFGHFLDLECLRCVYHQQDMADEIDISPYSKSLRLYCVVSSVNIAVEIGSR